MIEFGIGVLAGLAGHLALYDICLTLPFPDLSSHASGVLIAYPLARAIHKKRGDFDAAFLISFLAVGTGVFVGRVLRGMRGK